MLTKESQNTEFKRIWKDEYLRHICAFANSRGGSLFIGVMDDGSVEGIDGSKKLLEDIPNKTIHALGVYVEVVLHKSDKLEYLEIKAQPNTVPISFKGVYYVRSGTTTQELKGAALQEFILKKMGRTFDELFMPGTSLDDIDAKPVRRFLRKAVNANRITPESETDSLKNILSNLKLMNDNGELNYAALLLFGNDPLRFFSSVSFRIGRFGNSDHDLRFQDVIEGNVFEMPDRVIETLRAKYLVSPIRYEGLQRIEELEYPEDALREAVLNSIIHKDYTGVHIQLSVYDDKIILWNPGKLPDDIPIERLMQKHPSIPRNRLIADIFFKAGYIEAWGRGIDKIKQGFQKTGKPTPLFEEIGGGLMLTLYKEDSGKDSKELEVSVTENVTERRLVSILKELNLNPKISYDQLGEKLGVTRMTIYRDIEILKQADKIKRIGPAKGGRWEVLSD